MRAPRFSPTEGCIQAAIPARASSQASPEAYGTRVLEPALDGLQTPGGNFLVSLAARDAQPIGHLDHGSHQWLTAGFRTPALVAVAGDTNS